MVAIIIHRDALQRFRPGGDAAFTYDDLNRQTSRTLPDGELETTTYDAFGNVMLVKLYAAPVGGVYGAAIQMTWSVYDTSAAHGGRLTVSVRRSTPSRVAGIL